MSRKRRDRRKSPASGPLRYWPVYVVLFFWLVGSVLLVAMQPGRAVVLGLVDGLAVGIVLGATGLVRSYDESWDEFWEATTLSYLLGILAILIYIARREPPSTFFLIECAAGTLSYAMLAFVPPLTWLGADLMLFTGTFVGWFFSGLFRSGYD